MNGERYDTIPRKLWSSPLFCGSGISLMALTFDRSRWVPCLSLTQPKNLTELLLTSHFFLFSTSPCSLATFMNLFSLLLCSALSLPCMMISSVIQMTPSQQSRIWSIILGKISCAHVSPNGRCTKWNHPFCVHWRLSEEMIHSRELCNSKMKIHPPKWIWYYQLAHEWFLPVLVSCSGPIW